MRKVTMALGVAMLCSTALLGAQALDLVATARDKAIGVLEAARLVADRKGDVGSVLALDELIARLRQPLVVQSVKARKTFYVKPTVPPGRGPEYPVDTGIELRPGDMLLVRIEATEVFKDQNHVDPSLVESTVPRIFWGLRQTDSMGRWTKWAVKKELALVERDAQGSRFVPRVVAPVGAHSVVHTERLAIEVEGKLVFFRGENYSQSSKGNTHDVKVEVTVLEGGGKTPD